MGYYFELEIDDTYYEDHSYPSPELQLHFLLAFQRYACNIVGVLFQYRKVEFNCGGIEMFAKATTKDC